MDLIEHANSKRRMVVLVTAFAAVAAGIVFSLMIILEMVLPTVNLGPPTHTVDTTIFEMWLGSLSTHQGLSIPVV